MTNLCGSCYYFDNRICRRYPPGITTSWPVVEPEDWCGEFKQVDTLLITLTSLQPNSLVAGTTPATVDVIGTGFDSTCTIYADSNSRATFYIDVNHLQFTARPDLETSGTTVQITVQNGAGDTSNALPLEFT